MRSFVTVGRASRPRLFPLLLLPVLLHLGAAVASAQVSVSLTVTGQEARGSFDIGGIGADLTLTFEQSVGLHAGSLEVTAAVVDPLDPDLLSRLPPPVEIPLGELLGSTLKAVTIPAAFPVLLRIGPSEASPLSFGGIYTLALHTHNLHFDRTIPFALYKAHDGGPFHDIMATEGRGSYRAGGGGGDFSEFLLVIDARPIDFVIVEKFDALSALLTEHEEVMAPAAVAALRSILDQARALYQAGALGPAKAQMRAFSREVTRRSGQEIPDVWRANCNTPTNVAGLLRSAADTLRFSLDRKMDD
jgi:hypothetical protein